MLTIVPAENISQPTAESQNENLPSDIEIWRRVREIRAGWSVTERVRRRREAEHRFADLLDSLSVDG